MKCPKCNSFMKHITYEGVEIERCIRCYGMWFDSYEPEQLKRISGSEVVDIGDKDIGKEQNETTKINCPTCNVLMLQETDKQQPHIHYERCPTCQGAYFDAGEFRDYKHLTLGEFFKSVFTHHK